VAYCCAQGNDLSVSIKDGELLECLDNCELSKTIVKGYQMTVIELGRKLSEAFA
jgi:hypothetical protein